MSDSEALRVLIVDDDPAARTLCRRLLEREGYQVGEACDGLEALTEIEDYSPHIVVMDAVMSGMDGLECTRRIKSAPDTRDIRVIMTSALSEAADIIAGLEAGADEYLTKPIRPREFTLRVGSMARLQRSHLDLLRSNEVRGEQARILTLLLDFCQELAATETLDAILERTVAVTAEVLFSRRVAVLLPDDSGCYLTVARSLGIDDEATVSMRVPVAETTIGGVFESRGAAVINNQAEARVRCWKGDPPCLSGVPLISTALATWESVVGVLNITGRLQGRPFAPVELEYVDLISSIAASAMHECTARQARDDARNCIVTALASLAEHRDFETGKHLDRVTRFSLIIAEELRSSGEFGETIDDTFLNDLERAVPLHDIGKVAIPDQILLKPGKLTSAEMAVMKTHAEIGAATIRSVLTRARGGRFLAMAEEVAHGHHERYDGAGYPRGLGQEQIHLSARIVALADVYDALTTRRVYKEALSHERSQAIILEGSGSQFDPAVVGAFRRRADQFAQLAVELADEPHPVAEVSAAGHI